MAETPFPAVFSLWMTCPIHGRIGKQKTLIRRSAPCVFGGALLIGANLLAQMAPPPLPAAPTERRAAQVLRREARQQRRIAQGVRSGALMPKETAHLERQEAWVVLQP